MKSSHYQAVIFDLDGVITDTAHFHFMAWKQLALSQGIHLDLSFNEALKGIDRMGSLERILALSARQYTLEQKLALADLKNQHYQQAIIGMGPQDLLPGALNTLINLKQRGLRIGLASVSKNAFTVLERLNIRHCFDVVVDAAEIVHSKPDPEIFLRAASLLDVAPAYCLGVEDSIAGISAIKSAGMFALGIGQANVLTQADVVIPSLAQFDLNAY